MSASRSLRRFGWATLAFNVATVLWGAYVRATGSGAGCGDHWPLCNGEVLPRSPSATMLIELSHRTSSGVAGLLVLALLVWAFRALPAGHPARPAAVTSFGLMLLEGALGAALVKLKLVAHDASLYRGAAASAHLVNTFLLLGSLAILAARLSGQARFGRGVATRHLVALGAGAAALLVLGVSGAVTALGDTLFPAASLHAALGQDFSPAAHLFVRLRILHPLLAIAAAAVASLALHRTATVQRSLWTLRGARAVTALFAVQLGLGALNVALLAPVWLQLVHLLVADLTWLGYVLTAATALGAAQASAPAETLAAAGKLHEPA